MEGTILLAGISVLIGALVTFYVSRRYYLKASEDLRQESQALKQGTEALKRETERVRREAEELRQLTIRLTQILAGQGVIEVKEWDPETGGPAKWPVGKSMEIRYKVEAYPWWRRVLVRLRRRLGR